VTSYVRRRAGTALPRELVRAVRRMDEHQLRRLLILVRGLLIGSDGPTVELDAVPGVPTVHYRQQHIRCGKGCESCPHGPYWYAYWKEGGRSQSQYIGNQLPADVRRLLEAADAERPDADTDGLLTPVTKLSAAATDRNR
jgi:hypothetical protein